MSDKLEINNFKIIDGNQIRIYDNRVNTKDISKTFALNDVEVRSIGRKAESLEDYFLKLTGGEVK